MLLTFPGGLCIGFQRCLLKKRKTQMIKFFQFLKRKYIFLSKVKGKITKKLFQGSLKTPSLRL